MKTQWLSLPLLGMGLIVALPAVAQDTSKYDPIMEKRAGLRVQYLRAQREAAHQAAMQQATEGQNRSGLRQHRAHRKDTGTSGVTIIPAQDNPYLVAFQALSNKRADLRMNITRKGLNAAFSEWLRYERPRAYQNYIMDTGANR
ncbi:MAG TPA: hypothetical protein VFB38_25380 [Chthonomonadaceae bacterium]|nr:hypothetical protein [Chthonomonadaceae bacterium]